MILPYFSLFGCNRGHEVVDAYTTVDSRNEVVVAGVEFGTRQINEYRAFPVKEQ